MNRFALAALFTAVLVAVIAGCSSESSGDAAESYTWTVVNDNADWGRRAGLRAAEVDGSIYVMGGRTPRPSTIPGDSEIWSDVWRSDDLGETWSQILENGNDASWSGRAYFQTVVKDGEMFVLGGQDYGLFENPYCELLEQGLKPPPGLGIDPDAPCPEFLPTSEFFNDVWRSTDGVAWTEATAAAPWSGRAGLSAVVLGEYIYVLGGSTNDDAAIIGPNGRARIYFNDVWRSTDGADWELVTDEAPWEPRAGASVVAFRDEIWLFGARTASPTHRSQNASRPTSTMFGSPLTVSRGPLSVPAPTGRHARDISARSSARRFHASAVSVWSRTPPTPGSPAMVLSGRSMTRSRGTQRIPPTSSTTSIRSPSMLTAPMSS